MKGGLWKAFWGNLMEVRELSSEMHFGAVTCPYGKRMNEPEVLGEIPNKQ